MSFETISLTTDSRGVATLTLNQPDKHNAMSGRMIEELTLAAAQLSEDESVRAVVLTGKGRSFCAGGDLDWMRAQFEADRKARIAEAMKLASALRNLNELPKPVIGKINGQAFGGGIGLISICDVAVGIDTAKFALTETRLGLIPATISPYVIARMGEAKARRVFMSGRRFDANEAVELGLLAKAVSADDMDNAVEAELAPYFETAPQATGKAKQLARWLGPRIDDEVIHASATALADCWESAETQEGITAFFNKEKPGWQR